MMGQIETYANLNIPGSREPVLAQIYGFYPFEFAKKLPVQAISQMANEAATLFNLITSIPGSQFQGLRMRIGSEGPVVEFTHNSTTDYIVSVMHGLDGLQFVYDRKFKVLMQRSHDVHGYGMPYSPEYTKNITGEIRDHARMTYQIL
jgi:hypothetical protein